MLKHVEHSNGLSVRRETQERQGSFLLVGIVVLPLPVGVHAHFVPAPVVDQRHLRIFTVRRPLSLFAVESRLPNPEFPGEKVQ